MRQKHPQQTGSFAATATTAEIFRKFIIFYIPIAVIIIAVMGYAKQAEYEKRTAVRIIGEHERVHLGQATLVRDLGVLSGDLFVLAESTALADYLESPSRERMDNLEKRFVNFSQDRGLYTQIRYIDTTGTEVVRVDNHDGNISVVLRSPLQQKSERYYFSQTMQLSPGSIYVSTMDLNTEKGEVKRPFAPMLRVAIPLIDSRGDQRGMLAINYLAEKMLDRFRSLLPSNDDVEYVILNADGYWLSSPTKELEWGFVFGKDKTFQTRYPDVWKVIVHQKSGTIQTKQGLFTFETVLPEKEIKQVFAKRGPLPLIDPDNHPRPRLAWHVVSRVAPKPAQLGILSGQQVIWQIAMGAILLLTGIGIWQTARAQIVSKKATTALHLLSTGLEQSPAAVIITNHEGTVEYINPIFSTLSGYEPDEVLGQNPRILKSGEMSPKNYAHLWQTIRSGKTWSGEFHNRRKDNSRYWANAQISPIIDRCGKITHFIGIQEDVTEKKFLQAKLERMAKIDPLTGAFSRGQLMELLRHEIQRCVRYNHPLTALMMDIDHFKSVNDRYGHLGGDQALVEFIQAVSAALRTNDFVGRYGGEEFIAVLPETSEDEAMLVAERIRNRVANLSVAYDSDKIYFTVSIGCSQWIPEDRSGEEMIKRTDEALYIAKKAGRNRVKRG